MQIFSAKILRRGLAFASTLDRAASAVPQSRSAEIILVAALVMQTATAIADPNIRVTQQGKRFSVNELTIRRHQSITFINEDETRHNVAVDGPSGPQISIVQEPGQFNAIPFDQPGTFAVSCLIHPKMHLSVTVK